MVCSSLGEGGVVGSDRGLGRRVDAGSDGAEDAEEMQ